MTNKVHHIEKDVESRIEEMKEKANEIKEKAHEIEEEVEAYAKIAKQYIKKNPVKSTVIAGIAGIFIGKLLGR